MTFVEKLEQVRELLQSKGRMSYRALKRQFDLDDDYLADLKEELLYTHAQQVREEGPGLVWISAAPVPSTTQSPAPDPQPPSTYTPPHLAERIRAATLTGRAQDDHRAVC